MRTIIFRSNVGFRWLLILALSFSSAVALAENRIEAVRVLSESRDTVDFDVTYEYSGDRGTNVFMQVLMSSKGEPLRHYAVRPGRVEVGRHRTRVSLSVSESTTTVLTSNEVVVTMYGGGGKTFFEQPFTFYKTWIRGDSPLTPVFRVSMIETPIFVPMQPLETPSTDSGSNSGHVTNGTIRRRILPNGHIELRDVDGTIRRYYPGGFSITRPDGQEEMYSFSSAQPPTPPSAPPDHIHSQWLQAENQQLLEIVRALVSNHEPSIDHLMSLESPHDTEYQRIDSRTRVIGMLVIP